MTNRAANDALAEYCRDRIRAAVDDPEVADMLCPKGFPIGAKRFCLDTDYYATFNLPHVRLVDLRAHPLEGVTGTGIDTVDESFEFDAIVFATGFDALTGAINAVHITGRDGGPARRLGGRSANLPGVDHCRLPESVPDHRSGQARRCCRTWRCRSSSTSSGWRTA